MTLPVRAGVRVTQCALHTSLTVSARTLSLAGGALHVPPPAPLAASTPPPAHVSEEHVEIAIYLRIETLATEVGDKDTAQLAKSIRRDEERISAVR